VTTDRASLEYLRGHLENALATDARVMEQGLSVRVDDGTLVVSGVVSTPQRRAAVDDVTRDVAASTPFRNETTVVHLGEPGSAEVI
jgi:osmotically-inducible protein OsmY